MDLNPSSPSLQEVLNRHLWLAASEKFLSNPSATSFKVTIGDYPLVESPDLGVRVAHRVARRTGTLAQAVKAFNERQTVLSDHTKWVAQLVGTTQVYFKREKKRPKSPS